MPLTWTDGHLDLAYLAVSGRDILSAGPAPAGADAADGCVSLPALREAGVELAFATIYTEPGRDSDAGGWCYRDSADLDGAAVAGRRQLRIYQQLEADGEIAIVRDVEAISRVSALPKVLLLMEGADPVRSPVELAEWFDAGLRMIGLTWAMGTRYAGGNARPGGLTAVGRDMVRAIDALGMIHDASHLADEAFEDLLSNANGPIVATHSNCRSLLRSPDGIGNERHLRDDQVRRIDERGGIVGLNLFTKFLANGRRANVQDAVAHVERICEVMGHRRGVGLGSDMDGGFPPAELPHGLDHPAKLGALAEALCDAGWSVEDVRGFASENWKRFLRRTLPGGAEAPAAMRTGTRSNVSD